MELDLAGRAAIVTGANKGIGAACARRLAAEGARVLLTARDPGHLDAAAEAARAAGGEAATLSEDLRADGAPERIVAAARAAFGGVDILVNAAGAAQGGAFEAIEDAVWRDAFDLKFFATQRMIRAALPALRARGGGRIVTIVGNLGRQPQPRLLPGACANAALLALNTGLAQEAAADGVVMLTVSPGPTRSERWTGLMDRLGRERGARPEEVEREFIEQIPMRRIGETDEIAAMTAFLCSPRAANMTGTDVTMDGGWSRMIG